MAPGQLGVRSISLTQKNELVVDAVTTLMLFKDCCYVFLQIPEMRVQGAKGDTFARLALTSSNMLARTKQLNIFDE